MAYSNFPDLAGSLQALTNRTTAFCCGVELFDSDTFHRPPLMIQHGVGCLGLGAVSYMECHLDSQLQAVVFWQMVAAVNGHLAALKGH